MWVRRTPRMMWQQSQEVASNGGLSGLDVKARNLTPWHWTGHLYGAFPSESSFWPLNGPSRTSISVLIYPFPLPQNHQGTWLSRIDKHFLPERFSLHCLSTWHASGEAVPSLSIGNVACGENKVPCPVWWAWDKTSEPEWLRHLNCLGRLLSWLSSCSSYIQTVQISKSKIK